MEFNSKISSPTEEVFYGVFPRNSLCKSYKISYKINFNYEIGFLSIPCSSINVFPSKNI